MVVSRYVMGFWVDFYARDYGGLGVVLAICSADWSGPSTPRYRLQTLIATPAADPGSWRSTNAAARARLALSTSGS